MGGGIRILLENTSWYKWVSLCNKQILYTPEEYKTCFAITKLITDTIIAAADNQKWDQVYIKFLPVSYKTLESLIGIDIYPVDRLYAYSDPSEFLPYMSDADNISEFWNLSKDSWIIAPSFFWVDSDCHPEHLLSFLKSSSTHHLYYWWYSVGYSILQKLAEQPADTFYIDTQHSESVPWLHVRITQKR